MASRVGEHGIPLCRESAATASRAARLRFSLSAAGEVLDGEPLVPEGLWYKRFSGMTVCGEGELIKTFLLPGQAPTRTIAELKSKRGSDRPREDGEEIWGMISTHPLEKIE